jgi:hypothetical protein
LVRRSHSGNQGPGLAWTVDYMYRFLEKMAFSPNEIQERATNPYAYWRFARSSKGERPNTAFVAWLSFPHIAYEDRPKT